MPIVEIIPTRGVPVRVWASDLDPATRQQLIQLAESGLAIEAVAAMPDAHYGKGATVGSVFVGERAVCPNAVGVDIGCGMAAVPLRGITASELSRPTLEAIHRRIKQVVPTGFGMHPVPVDDPIFDDTACTPWLRRQLSSEVRRQLGTLGGGNHFIEIVRDEQETVWIMLHSGSRRIGKLVAEHYQELAERQTRQRGETPPNRDLASLLIASEEGQQYLADMSWCQRYAIANRQHMLQAVAGVIRSLTGAQPDWSRAINIHHNYCARERVVLADGSERDLWVTRKGATSARRGQLGLIPGSMGVGSFIVRGLGNPLSFQSCSHGAGRRLSRGAAIRQIPQEEFERAMRGIVAETVPELRDEAPQAYKDLTQVMQNQADLVEPVSRLLPLLNVKGVEGDRYRKVLKRERALKSATAEIEELTV
ncbi:MAG: RNA-splicing ligase RtcB [Dehalococcoidia bacterium]|nr:MAG: RNA-splicing ligase RtcB [Dehalococcoidia bacterium]